MFSGKGILITGGTGSFGTQFVRTLIKDFEPKRLVIYSRDELKQYDMQQEFSAPFMRYFLGDVRDKERLSTAMSGIDIVVHAAALKQVPAAEYNPMECINTNVHGAENIIRAALENNVEKVIALSTDKAASPINLYGATKLLSDKLFVSANNIVGTHKTGFSIVRYGNVLGSRGSVVPYFRQLLASGATELPITDKRMTRFWITLQQGVDFVIKSFERMQGGEIFIPKIPSVRITDIAAAMAPKTGIKVIGIRPGEKLHELLYSHDESHLVLEYDGHYLVQPAIDFYEHSPGFSSGGKDKSVKHVAEGFEYSSKDNARFLTVEEIRDNLVADGHIPQ